MPLKKEDGSLFNEKFPSSKCTKVRTFLRVCKIELSVKLVENSKNSSKFRLIDVQISQVTAIMNIGISSPIFVENIE